LNALHSSSINIASTVLHYMNIVHAIRGLTVSEGKLLTLALTGGLLAFILFFIILIFNV